MINGVDEKLKQIILQALEKFTVELIEMEVMPDHVHVLLEIDPQFGVHKLIGYLKGLSSRLLRKEFPILKRLSSLWTNSYFISTIGGAPLKVLKQYVQQQKHK